MPPTMVSLRLILGALCLPIASAVAQPVSCLVIGDSIAYGAAMYAPGCLAAVKPGVTSEGWLKHWVDVPKANKVLIALGTNDPTELRAYSALWKLRAGLKAETVYWIAPGQAAAGREAVFRVAKSFGDVVYEGPKSQIAADNIHFKKEGYRMIASLLSR